LEEKYRGKLRACAKEDEDFIINGHLHNPILSHLYPILENQGACGYGYGGYPKDGASQGKKGKALDLIPFELKRKC